jgi:hypothetical protein
MNLSSQPPAGDSRDNTRNGKNTGCNPEVGHRPWLPLDSLAALAPVLQRSNDVSEIVLPAASLPEDSTL